jgi:hypothetical protein
VGTYHYEKPLETRRRELENCGCGLRESVNFNSPKIPLTSTRFFPSHQISFAEEPALGNIRSIIEWKKMSENGPDRDKKLR